MGLGEEVEVEQVVNPCTNGLDKFLGRLGSGMLICKHDVKRNLPQQ